MIDFVIGFVAGAVCAAVVPYVGDLAKTGWSKLAALFNKRPDDTDQAGA